MHVFRPKYKLFTVAFASLCLFSLGGCTPMGVLQEGQNPQLVASPDKATLLLAQSADKASTALETLAAIEQAQKPAAAVAPIGHVPAELARAMTISWVGPVEPITRTLANHSEYEFQVLGDAPPVPIVINLESENRRVIDLLRDIGLQLGRRADIKVDAPSKTVELQYAPIGAGLSGGF